MTPQPPQGLAGAARRAEAPGREAGRAAVFLLVYFYPFDKSPSLQNLARDLMQTHATRVLLDHRFAGPMAADLAACVQTARPPAAPAAAGTAYRRGRLERFVRERLPGWLRRGLRDLFLAQQLLVHLPRFCRFVRRQTPSGLVIAADKPSLLAALLAGRVPRIYYSLEATPLREEDSLTYRLLNVIETLYVRLAQPLVIGQSPARASLIQPDATRQILIPVTSDGPAFARSPHLRERLGIDPQSCIVLIAGGLGPDQMCFEILDSVRHWNPRHVLVLHSASGQFAPELLAAAQAGVQAGRVRLSTQHFTIEEAERLVYASADVGIVYYRDLGFNHRHTAYSSGKLAAFLRAGVPVIVPDFEEFRAALAAFRFGEVSPVQDIGRQVEAIMARHEDYARAARAAFEQVYSFKNYARRVADRIAGMDP